MTSERSKPRIVVGIDGSEQSTHALHWAQCLATTAGAQLEAVAAWQLPLAAEWGTPSVPYNWDPEADMDKLLTQTVDAAFGADRPSDLRLVVTEGHPARVLLERSADALMLVVGSRGHGGFAGLLLGSISANVAEHASCPVLVVHGNELPDTI
jgi:nucleotide-binding universal stress UspA family protein